VCRAAHRVVAAVLAVRRAGPPRRTHVARTAAGPHLCECAIMVGNSLLAVCTTLYNTHKCKTPCPETSPVPQSSG
jgi:hypothetical protein